jgi:hypothetical protein
MIPAYSKRFMSGRALAHENVRIYEVPAGKVAVVRDFSGLRQSEIEPSECAFLGPFDETIYQTEKPPFVEAGRYFVGGSFQWHGHAVFYAGENIKVVGLGGLCDFYLSGYLLSAEV